MDLISKIASAIGTIVAGLAVISFVLLITVGVPWMAITCVKYMWEHPIF